MYYQLPWDGTKIEGPILALDTETELADEKTRQPPRIVLATVSSSTRNCVLRPDQLVQFFLQHPDTEFVGHNIAFDFWAIHRYLGDENGQFLLDIADRGRF